MDVKRGIPSNETIPSLMIPGQLARVGFGELKQTRIRTPIHCATIAKCRRPNDANAALFAPASLPFESFFWASAYHSRHEAKARRPTAGGSAVAFKPRVRAVSSNEFLTPVEFADTIGVSRQTVVRWVRAGLPCSVRRGAVVRIDMEQARTWLTDPSPAADSTSVEPKAKPNGKAKMGAKTKPRRVGRPRNVDRFKKK